MQGINWKYQKSRVIMHWLPYDGSSRVDHIFSQPYLFLWSFKLLFAPCCGDMISHTHTVQFVCNPEKTMAIFLLLPRVGESRRSVCRSCPNYCEEPWNRWVIQGAKVSSPLLTDSMGTLQRLPKATGLVCVWFGNFDVDTIILRHRLNSSIN